MKFDFNTYVDKYISCLDRDNYLSRKDEIISKFLSCDMIGWTRNIDNDLVDRIIIL